MKFINHFLPLAFTVLLFTSCNSKAQNPTQSTTASSNAEIEVIQFHSENRCKTCLAIESLTRETLKDYPAISFSTVNVDKSENEKMADEFEAFGTSLFLYNPETGAKKNLTEFAFMNAGKEEKFRQELREEIDQFLKS
ncbi:nitrophenyl compound nitroreductase subunit ArsF family protein [Salinimicrobium xinjiangense]|uniref:nitrophenyl compound nitroreductase subunit ArsF family protein n=1 Tax=Salinimicrobium xinjiangense TaxID=438596 RepID=UPI00048ABFE3|nr:nitrophenyl compound nitroreductase subunit ArsF family protein [Salinimicrobium xinjiangense]